MGPAALAVLLGMALLPAPESYDPAAHPGITTLYLGDPMAEKVEAALKDALGNWPELAGAIRDATPGEREDLFWLLDHLAHIDRLEATGAALLEHVQLAREAREGVPDDLYREYVLDPVFWREHFSSWRGPVTAEVAGMRSAGPRATALRVNRWIARRFGKAQPDRLGPPLTPDLALRVRRGTPLDLSVLAGAALRALGVPARLGRGGEWTEFHDGKDWVPLYPLDLGSFGKDSRSEVVKREFQERARLELRFTRDGAPDPKFEGSGIAELRDGLWEEVQGIEAKTEGELQIVEVPGGEYLLTSGVRNPNGDAWVTAMPVRLGAGQTLRLEIPVDLPAEKAGVGEEIPALRPIVLRGEDGKPLPPLGEWNTSGLLLFLFDPEGEPSIRMMEALRSVEREMAGKGVRVVTVPLTGAGGPIRDALGIREPPSWPVVVLLDREFRPLLRIEGYDLNLGERLRETVGRMP